MNEQSLSDAFMRLVKIMDELREGCPWDRKQTIQTLRSLTIEELYELTDAVLAENWVGIKEELGDLFLHLLFYARIAREQEKFNLEEVLTGISDKLISRHPHIYGTVKVNDEEDVKRNWENLKLKEGKKSILEVSRLHCRQSSKRSACRKNPGRWVSNGIIAARCGRKWKKKLGN